jgi:hypothetical protein
MAAAMAHGLPVRVVGVEFMPPWNGYRLLAIKLDIDEVYLPRSHQQRGFDLHITLLFEAELSDTLEEAAIRLHNRWSGRHHLLRIGWVGSGCAAFLKGTDALASDPDVVRLHSAGYYADRGLHVSL